MNSIGSLVKGSAVEDQRCELCKKAPRRKPGLLLCQDCADVVSRVMSCEIYEANHDRDRQVQLAQARLFMKAVRSAESTYQATAISDETATSKMVE